MEVCYEWAVEVDQNRQRCNLETREKFIVQSIGSLYNHIQDAAEKAK